MTSPIIIAALRARAVMHDKFTIHVRYFSASTELDGWSAADMAGVMAQLASELELTIADPARLLDADLNMFAPLEETTPAYRAHLEKLRTATARSVDPKKPAHFVYQKVSEYNVYARVMHL
jgi:hypothetical protein